MRRLVALLVAAGLGAAIFVAGALLPTRASQSPHKSSDLIQNGEQTTSGSQKLQQAIRSLQSQVRANPRDPEALSSLGLAYLQEARLTVNPSFYSKADQVLRRSVALDGKTNFQGFLGMGALSAARHRFGGALRWGKQAQTANPYNAEARGVVADALVELGRYGQAAKALQKMVDLRPGLASLSRVSYFRELNGDLRGAKGAMTDAFADAGGSGQDAAWASYQLGELEMIAGDLRRANFFYRRGRYLDPEYYLPRVGIAKVAAATGDLSRAGQILKRVVTTYPAPVYVMLLGDIYRAEGMRVQADRQYGLVRAEQELFSANGVIPDTEMMVFFADHHERLNQTLREAQREYSKRPSVRVADALGWLLYTKGKFAEASTYSRKALRLGTVDPTYYFHAGMISRAAGNRTLALRYLHRALRFNPHFSVRYAPEAVRAVRLLEAKV